MGEDNGQKSSFNVSSQGVQKKKGKGGIIFAIIVIIILLALIGGGAIWYFGNKGPDKLYKKIISSNIDKYTEKIENLNYRTSKTNLKINANIDTNNGKIKEDVVDVINNTNIEIDAQTDIENKNMIVNLNSTYKYDKLINGQIYSNFGTEETYLYVKDLLDKYVELDFSSIEISEEIYTSLKYIVEIINDMNKEQTTINKAEKIVKNELLKVVKPEYCTSSKEKIDINGKTISTTKNTLTLTGKQFQDELKTVIINF